jgi:hypothetical protein
VVCRDVTTPETPSDSESDITVLIAEDSTEEEEQGDDYVLCTGRFSEDQNVEEWIKMCEIFQMGAHTFCWYGGRFCL